MTQVAPSPTFSGRPEYFTARAPSANHRRLAQFRAPFGYRTARRAQAAMSCPGPARVPIAAAVHRVTGVLAESGAKTAKEGHAPHGGEPPFVPVGASHALLNWEQVVSVMAQDVPNSHA